PSSEWRLCCCSNRTACWAGALHCEDNMVSHEKTMNANRAEQATGSAQVRQAGASPNMTRGAWVVGALVLILLVALPWVAPYFYIFIATEVLILGLLAASFNLIFGYTGMLSFGHAAFFGIGSYAVAMLLQAYQWPLLACLLAAVVVATVLALVIGFFCVRLNEVYFAMLTLAFGMMVFSIAHQWRSVTNGSDGIAGFAVTSFGLGLDLQLGNPSVYYHVVLVIVMLAAALLYLIC